jgi:hypothetical protein
MKKQASDQQAHERRYQQRKQAEAAKKPLKPAPRQDTSGSGPTRSESAKQDKTRES